MGGDAWLAAARVALRTPGCRDETPGLGTQRLHGPAADRPIHWPLSAGRGQAARLRAACAVRPFDRHRFSISPVSRTPWARSGRGGHTCTHAHTHAQARTPQPPGAVARLFAVTSNCSPSTRASPFAALGGAHTTVRGNSRGVWGLTHGTKPQVSHCIHIHTFRDLVSVPLKQNGLQNTVFSVLFKKGQKKKKKGWTRCLAQPSREQLAEDGCPPTLPP